VTGGCIRKYSLGCGGAIFMKIFSMTFIIFYLPCFSREVYFMPGADGDEA
jgi:hypothetical protein